MIELVILDMYGTIVGLDLDIKPRAGFYDFMRRYYDKPIVISTDDPFLDSVEQNLDDLEVKDQIDRIYFGEDMVGIDGYLGERKDLRKICDDFNVQPENAVFISDGVRDKADAKRDEVKFIHVPKFDEKIDKFSFDIIDLEGKLPKYRDYRNINDS